MDNTRQLPRFRCTHRTHLSTLLLLGAILTYSASAQVTSSYNFQRTVAPYADLPTSSIIMKEWTGGQQALLGLGDRTFRFFGHDIDFGDTNNYIALIDIGELIIGGDTLQFTLPGFLAGLRSRDESSSISHGIFSYLNDSVYIVQWKNAGFLTGDTADFVNFQIWIYMRSGVIEYHYGSHLVPDAEPFAGTDGPSVGLVISDRGIASWFSSVFLTGSPTNPLAEPNSFFPSITGVPTNGTVYRFTPTVVASVTTTDNQLNDLRAYPNPVHDRLTIELPQGSVNAGATATIYDILGRAVGNYSLNSSASVLDVRELPSGIYNVEIRSGATRRTMKISKQ